MTSTSKYYCSSCKIALKSKTGWLHHLLSPDHQAKAREDFAGWDFQTKDRVLAAFGKFAVATEAVLKAFSDQDGRSNLSGFVWSDNRRRVGLLLFESREMVNAIMNGLSEGSRMKIGNYQVLQLRKATDYLDYEWEELIAQDIRSEFSMGLMAELKIEGDDDKLPIPKRIKLSDSDLSDISGDEDESEFYSHGMELEEDIVEDNARVIKVEPGEGESNLSSQWDLICREMEIQDEVYNAALDMMEKCRRILHPKLHHCRLYMFRNWYLKLRGQGANELLLFVDADGILNSGSSSTVGTAKKPSLEIMKILFTAPRAKKIFPGLRYLQENVMDEGLGFPDSSLHHFEDTANKVRFTLVTDQRYAVEAQTCRLLNYLLDFDPRARPFLTLIYYWAEQNGVAISGSSSAIKNHVSYSFPPEPAGLEWMVIFFLCRKGILPSPRNILRGTEHSEVWYFLYKGKKYENNIGFRNDAQFAEEWRAAARNPFVVGSDELFLLHLVELGKEFFTFYGELCSTPQKWVLNTRDGKLIRKDDLLDDNLTKFESGLAKDELQALRNPGKKLTKLHVKLNELWKPNRRLVILHPLIINWTIPFDDDNFSTKTCLVMLASAKIIEMGLPTLEGTAEEEEKDEAENKKGMIILRNLFGKVDVERSGPPDGAVE